MHTSGRWRGMRWSNRGDEAQEKQRSRDEEEPEEMQSRGDQDQAEHKQPRADKDKESPGLHHLGQNKKERPKQNGHKGRRKGTRHPPDWTIQGGTSSRGRHPPTGTSKDRWRPDAPDGCIWNGKRSRGSRPPDWNIRGQAAAERGGWQRLPRRAREADTRARQWRCSEAEWRTRPRRSRETKMRRRPRRCSDAHKTTRMQE